MSELKRDIEHAINCACAENGSNTPDFILAEYLTDCLAAFDKASRKREMWYGTALQIGGPVRLPREGEPAQTLTEVQALAQLEGMDFGLRASKG